MIRKIVLLCALVPIAALIAGQFFSACRPVRVDKEAYVCGITFDAKGAKTNDTILLDKPVVFYVGTTAKGICAAPAMPNPFVQSAYAASPPCFNWKNNLIQSSFHLTFDRSIMLEGDTIAAGTDVLQEYNFKRHAVFQSMGSQCDDQDHYLTLGDTLLQKMVFHPGVYKASFDCKTTDGRPYWGHAYVIFRQ